MKFQELPKKTRTQLLSQKTQKISLYKYINNYLIIMFLLLLIPLTSADVYTGTCQGYIRNTEEQTIAGADVTTTVINCVVGCSQSTVSESTGYYDIANLNLPGNELLRVYAEKPSIYFDRFGSPAIEYGQATDNADPYQAAYIDVVICLPPDIPELVDELGTHDNFATLEWTSYPDYKGLYEIVDEFRIDSTTTTISNTIPPGGSPEQRSRDVTGLSTGTHTWRVRSCVKDSGSTLCCTSWQIDTFNVGNTQPTPPTLTPIGDTPPTTLNFEWTSGIDPDRDTTYDIYCYKIIEEDWTCTIKDDDIQSPISQEVFGCNYYQWRVQTCEKDWQDHLCSSWATDGFIACGLECPACSCGGGGGGGGGDGGGGCSTKSKTLVVTNQLTTEQDEAHKLLISFETTGASDNIWFKVNSSEFDFSDYPITTMQDSKAKFELIGKPKGEVPPGEYNITLDVFERNKKTISEQMSIRVKKPLLINVKRIAQEIPNRKSWWIYSLIAIIILIILYIYLKNRNPSVNKKIKEKVKSTLKKKV